MKRNIDDRVGYHIGVAAHFLQNNYNQKLAEFALTVAQAKVLFMLINYGDQLQSELQSRLYVKGSTMNGIVDSLLKKDLIEKNDSETDRRTKIIVLTEKGKALEETLWLETEHMEKDLMKGFSDNEKNQLLTLLKRIKQNLDE
ncbi:MarR family transcriptional regulator [Anaerobacillus arseniciselenatis]|uniref:MarR family transcriptional regulator n=1 Tax=Anaerobacillus arseniciselenatis TaxID=85682 RepID=A0A1S2LH74_9BACI|nr:MarR family transcriptional regulator [Anaerobacillus arseniciselenatis]OIJ11570.1 MarR family transcriptional regulator [Anaerobacillus arseniciselenatis]